MLKEKFRQDERGIWWRNTLYKKCGSNQLPPKGVFTEVPQEQATHVLSLQIEERAPEDGFRLCCTPIGRFTTIPDIDQATPSDWYTWLSNSLGKNSPAFFKKLEQVIGFDKIYFVELKEIK